MNDANTPVFHVQGVNPFKLATGTDRAGRAARREHAAAAPPGRALRDAGAAEPERSRRRRDPLRRRAVKLAIRKHWVDFLAIAGLALLGVAVAVYILSQQDLRFPLVEESPKQHRDRALERAGRAAGPGPDRARGRRRGRAGSPSVKVEDGIGRRRPRDRARVREPHPPRRDRAAASEDGAEGHVRRGRPGPRQAGSARAAGSRSPTRSRTSTRTRSTRRWTPTPGRT